MAGHCRRRYALAVFCVAVCCALRIRCVDPASRGRGSQGKGKAADAESALVVAKEVLKELEELRKLRRVWGERSKMPLKEQVALAGSEQTKVAVVTSFGQPALVHKEKLKALKKRTDRQHRHDWLHHEATGVISALLYNAKGSAEQAAYIKKKPPMECDFF